jgi:hypothetical protein
MNYNEFYLIDGSIDALLMKNKPKPRGNYFIRNFYYLDLVGKITIYCFICCSQDVKKNMQKGSFIFFRVSLGLFLWLSELLSDMKITYAIKNIWLYANSRFIVQNILYQSM